MTKACECDRCGIPLVKAKGPKCEPCEAHDKALAAKLAAGWTGDDE